MVTACVDAEDSGEPDDQHQAVEVGAPLIAAVTRPPDETAGDEDFEIYGVDPADVANHA